MILYNIEVCVCRNKENGKKIQKKTRNPQTINLHIYVKVYTARFHCVQSLYD